MKKFRLLIFIMMALSMVLYNVEPVLAFASTPSNSNGAPYASTTIVANGVNPILPMDEANSLTVNLAGTGSGSVTSSPSGIDCGDTCAFDFDPDTVVTLTATPAPGSTFTGWDGACTGSDTCEVTMSEAREVTATFTLIEYTLTVNSDHGTVTADPQKDTYHYGDFVTLTVTADPGWTYSTWSGSFTVSANPFSFHINADTEMTANYTQDEYTLAVTSDHGTVTADPQQDTYHYGDVVQLSVSADPGWTFDSWSGDAGGNDNPLSVPMNSNQSVTANYTQDEYTLAVTSDHGTVTADPQQDTYHYGDLVKLSVTVDPGWTFDSWSGDASGNDNPLSITMHSNQSVTANYTQDEYTLAVTSNHGTVTADPQQDTYHYGDLVKLSVSADPGWTFSGWSGDASGNDNPLSVTMNGNQSVTANYTQNEYTLATHVVGSGAINADKDGPYHYNEKVKLTAVPADGWSFSGWSGDLDGLVNPSDITITDNMSVTATFAKIPPTCYGLTVGHTGEGNDPAVSPDKSTGCAAGKYVAGEVISFNNAVPTIGWEIGNWTGTDDNSSKAATNSLTMPANAASIAVNYTQIEYTLTTNTVGTGSIDRDKNSPYHYGDIVKLTAIPGTNWFFSGWSGDASGTTNPLSITMNGNKSVTATFAQEYTLTITSPNGTVTKNPDQALYHSGDVVLLTATPDAGWFFASWSGDASGTTNPLSITMNGNKSVTVNYSVKIPAAPLLTAPANGAYTSNQNPTFTWGIVSNSNACQIQLEKTTNFISAPITLTGAWTYTPSTGLDVGEWYWRVRAVNPIGVTGAWSSVRSFTIVTAAPAAPVLSAPANSATVSGTPTFRWLAASGANAYRFEYSADSVNFTSPIISPVLTSPSYLPSAMPVGTFYWRVMSGNAARTWGVWSAYRTITIQAATPVAPLLVSPANALAIGNASPVFTWNSVAYTSTYQIQIDTLATFPHPQTASGGATSYNGATLADGKYYWRVRATGFTSTPGAWSSVRSFTIDTAAPAAPVLSAPANSATVSGTPTFRWLAASGANAYRFEYSADSVHFTSPTTSPVLTSTSFLPPTMPVGTFYWRVMSRDAAGNWSAWSAYRTITIQAATPVAPLLVSPANALPIGNASPVFTWNSVAYTSTYQIQIDTLATFPHPQTTTVGVTNYNGATLADGKYYWRVRATGFTSTPGAWSSVRSFTIDTAAPAAPVLSAPANSATVSGTPTFRWLAASGANAYRFEYSADSVHFTSPFTSAVLTSTSFLPPTMPVGTFYWHVMSRDAAGNWSAWSAYRTITIHPLIPVGPVLASPANALVTSSTTPAFQWDSVLYGNTYEIQISTVSTFVSTVQDHIGNVGVTYYIATALSNSKYYWRVRAINASSESGAWSVVRTLTIAH